MATDQDDSHVGSADRTDRSERGAGRAETPFQGVLENILEGFLALDQGFRCTYVNKAGAAFLNTTPDRVIGRTVWEVFPAARGPQLRAQITRAAQEKVFVKFEEHCKKCRRWYEWRCYPTDDHLAIFVEDITERRHMEDALRQSEQRYRKLFEANLAGVYLTRFDGMILDFNETMMKMLGYDSREEVFQHRSTDFYADPEFRQELLRLLRRDGIVPGRETLLQKKDGSPLYVIGAAALLADERTGEQYIQGVAVDITERKQAEEALRELTRTLENRVAGRTAELERRARQLQKLALELSETENRERRRLAEILHDDLQQTLAAVKFHLGLVKNRYEEDGIFQEMVGQIKRLLQEAIDKSRNLSHELSPPGLAHNDLGETFEWLARQVQEKHGLTTHLDIRDRIGPASEPIKSLLYQAAREMLFNIVKHAGVREATLRLRRRRGFFCLSVSDKGRGFDLEEFGRTAGSGLLSIQERVNVLGGHMKVRSRKGKGSTFLVTVPDREKPEDRKRRWRTEKEPALAAGRPIEDRAGGAARS